jgi:hypothetical protein
MLAAGLCWFCDPCVSSTASPSTESANSASLAAESIASLVEAEIAIDTFSWHSSMADFRLMVGLTSVLFQVFLLFAFYFGFFLSFRVILTGKGKPVYLLRLY